MSVLHRFQSEELMSPADTNDDDELFANPFAFIGSIFAVMMLYILFLLGVLAWRRYHLRVDDSHRDRQGNVFTVQEEASRDSRYNDIFYIEPNSVEAARIRAQLEKDDKDLPTYDEVIRMTSLVEPTAAPVSVSTITTSNASVNTADTVLSVPPYSEVDPYASTSRNVTTTDDVIIPPTPSTNANSNSAAVITLPITTPIITHTSSNV